MGWFDRAKEKLGLGSEAASTAPKPRTKSKEGRPPLREPPAGSSATVEDVLAARDRGDKDEARSILAAIDKGQGLRMVLRAAAALEAGDQEEVTRLLPQVARETPRWQLDLEVAAALDAGPEREQLIARAVQHGAEKWAIAWVHALSSDAAVSRKGLVDLLFEDPALARTVAVRDLAVPGAKADNDAIRRYAGFAHGRDTIRRFGAKWVAEVVARAP